MVHYLQLRNIAHDLEGRGPEEKFVSACLTDLADLLMVLEKAKIGECGYDPTDVAHTFRTTLTNLFERIEYV